MAAESCILVVDDEQQIRRLVRQTLERAGYRVCEAGTLKQALVEAAAAHPALVVLDLGLPDGDGAAFVSAVREWSSMPVLVLSARSDEADKISALDAGADDYLTKPFSVGELLARVRAHLRRAAASTAPGETLVRFGDVEVDLVRRAVQRGGAPVHLTALEYRLLTVLLANAGKVMTHRHLLRAVWGPAYVESTHYLRIYIGHLRQKLEADPTQPQHLRTEIGVGYRFQV
ncbi:two-component system response regulator KdpE [Denitromonas iodatirespirans]|uniref:Two-component system response regulator KdpE n=1 Tax=Denitromonas iodatirespirans TaxID=2795389 RepID=A0A944D7K2_DENI1|nr:two-component system response regulator KdpE [Denitromonas iodatirespirans]MBT0961515.1 two-component system response regulator KdpE [Denitromonas iodatirespirans]